MSAEVTEKQHEADRGKATAALRRWQALASQVRDFEPTVVILVARKAPRIAQAFDLDFGRSPQVLSDLAIPFIGRELRDARVAVVDDVVNVGSTLLRAKRAALAAGATEVEMFVIADNHHDARLAGLGEVNVVDPLPLDEESRAVLAAEIPSRLQALGRPYDLDFPLLLSRLPSEDTDFTRLYARLASRFGADSVYDLTTPMGAEAGIRRLTIEHSDRDGAPAKVRAYLNARSGECVLAPMRLRTPVPTGAPSEEWAARIFAEMGAEEGCSKEACGRLRVYLDSLAFGLRFVGQNADIFPCDRDSPLVPGEATFVFGPRMGVADRLLGGWPFWLEPCSPAGEQGEPSASPFLEEARSKEFLADLRRGIGESADELSVFIALFTALADWVGADRPADYRLQWPYTKEEIEADPYLRLRIGPTFTDLVEILVELTELPAEVARRAASRLLDRFIDDGGVVPTMAEYEGALYRIYRKGEKDPRDRVSRRMRRAWHESGKALSLTRASKVSAILAFSEDPEASDVAVATDTRGNVFCHAETVLHDKAEVTHRLLKTNQLERVRDRDSGS